MTIKNEIEIKYHDILRQANNHTFSQRDAAMWVGGLLRLKSLIVEGKVRFGEGSKPTAWRLNASDVLKHCRHN